MPRLPGHFDLLHHRDEEHPLPIGDGPGAELPQHQLHRDPDLAETRGDRRGPSSIPRRRRIWALRPASMVRLGNLQGSLLIEAELFEGLQPDVVVVESIWPNSAFVEGIGINLLTSAEPGLPRGGAVFHDTAIWVRTE